VVDFLLEGLSAFGALAAFDDRLLVKMSPEPVRLEDFAGVLADARVPS
jgi:hypothetical protein